MVESFASKVVQQRMAGHEFKIQHLGGCWTACTQLVLAANGVERSQEELKEALDVTVDGPKRITGLFKFFMDELGKGHHANNLTFD